MIHDTLQVFGFLAGLLLFMGLTHLAPRTGFRGKAARSVSVVIPCRNEETRLPLLIADLLAQTVVPLEIICVDDESEDDTARAAEAAGAKVLRVPPRPEGRLRKAWACETGARAASGDLLLFLDADVRFESRAVESLMDLPDEMPVSVRPHHLPARPYEHCSLFFNIVAVACTGAGLPFRVKPAGLFGSVLMIPRTLYREQGGHGVVRTQAFEDFSLGRAYTRNGVPYRLLLGGNVISYRMYPCGFRELFKDWTGSISSVAAGTPPALLTAAVLWILALTSAAIDPFIAAAGGEPVRFAVACAVYLLFALQVYLFSGMVGRFHPLASVFYPVFLAAFHLLTAGSVFARLVLGRIARKGRVIGLGR